MNAPSLRSAVDLRLGEKRDALRRISLAPLSSRLSARARQPISIRTLSPGSGRCHARPAAPTRQRLRSAAILLEIDSIADTARVLVLVLQHMRTPRSRTSAGKIASIPILHLSREWSSGKPGRFTAEAPSPARPALKSWRNITGGLQRLRKPAKGIPERTHSAHAHGCG